MTEEFILIPLIVRISAPKPKGGSLDVLQSIRSSLPDLPCSLSIYLESVESSSWVKSDAYFFQAEFFVNLRVSNEVMMTPEHIEKIFVLHLSANVANALDCSPANFREQGISLQILKMIKIF